MVTKRAGVLLWTLLITGLVLRGIVAQDGEVLMDIGFRPESDGFSFENYGGEAGAVNLTSVEMVRLFGEAVCSTPLDDEGGCELTPNAQMWMEETSSAMDGGHCEGMAVLSLLFYGESLLPSDFGGETTADLALDDNEWLQREIGLWWATQATSPTYEDVVTGPPSSIVQALIDGMEEQYYTIGIYLPDGDGGHAITPYAVVDMGGGIYYIMVYDNNYPGEERFIEVDTGAETWVYTGSTNPSEPEAEYAGDEFTGTLDLTPMWPRLEVQVCDFCGDADYSGEGDDDDYTGVSLNGRGSLVVTDNAGNQAGIVDGKIVNTIPGAKVLRGKNGFSNYRSPTIYVPVSIQFTVSIQAQEGFGQPATGIIITRQGTVTVLEGITPGDTPSTLEYDSGKINYHSGAGDEALNFRQGVSLGSGQDFLYQFIGASSAFIFELDPETGETRVAGDEDGSTFAVFVLRLNEDGSREEFYTPELTLEAGSFGALNAAAWTEGIDIEIQDENGNVLDRLSFENESAPEEMGFDEMGFDDSADNGGTDDDSSDTGDDDTGDDTGDNNTGGEDDAGDEGDSGD